MPVGLTKSNAPSQKNISQVQRFVAKNKKQKISEDGESRITAQAILLYLKSNTQNNVTTTPDPSDESINVDKVNASLGGKMKNVRMTDKSPPLFFSCSYKTKQNQDGTGTIG